MAKKKQEPQWEEMQRKTLGLWLAQGRGMGIYSYAAVIYEVTERRGNEWRTRTEQGDAVYVHDRADLQEIFEMTMIGYNRLMYEAKKLDKTS